MSVVSLLNVAVNNNPAPVGAPYEFEITFECLESLSKDLEWKLTYVGSATSSEHDQVLDSLLVGPVPVGVNKFQFVADPPDLKKIPDTEVIGVTVILLSCAYDDREFVRVGYYVNNEYTDEDLVNNPPTKPIMDKVQRNILAEKPRVTRFAIKWDSDESAPAEYPPEQPEADIAEDDEAAYGADEGEAEEEEEPAKIEGEDDEMGGTTEEKAQAQPQKDEDEASDAGSEDLEGESSGEDDEEGEEEGGEEPANADDMEMDDEQQPQQAQQQDRGMQQHVQHAQHADVMVH